ncbi:hypothetical protein ODZ83_09045 [Acaricomes phytoseiuli]|uniref:hypothetical protein n=1 Tax=Acaricomes phytoseiuli TaxID=291968 RepID=UPI00036E3E28|nr:hypothetical protein [Acaricomes phytoseiuli]MCW1250320.1 hypothetical protein [Acaricomes phytoseiuli]
MIARIFWLALGIAIGVLTFRKLNQTQQSLSPSGLNRTVKQLSEDAQGFSAAFRHGMSSRESELRQVLGLQEQNR